MIYKGKFTHLNRPEDYVAELEGVIDKTIYSGLEDMLSDLKELKEFKEFKRLVWEESGLDGNALGYFEDKSREI